MTKEECNKTYGDLIEIELDLREFCESIDNILRDYGSILSDDDKEILEDISYKYRGWLRSIDIEMRELANMKFDG